jgi:hypothetical protein
LASKGYRVLRFWNSAAQSGGCAGSHRRGAKHPPP